MQMSRELRTGVRNQYYFLDSNLINTHQVSVPLSSVEFLWHLQLCSSRGTDDRDDAVSYAHTLQLVQPADLNELSTSLEINSSTWVRLSFEEATVQLVLLLLLQLSGWIFRIKNQMCTFYKA